MLKARLWFARMAAVYAALIYSYLASLYILQPLDFIANFGIAVSGSPESINFIRTGLGAIFSGMALTAWFGLVRPGYLRASLAIIVLFNGCIVAARIFGIVVDGVTTIQLTELRAEGISWIIFLVALIVLPGSDDK
ncbi:DUF4345 family protein [Oceanicoccus sp. KOV_DT_Chl]|uniref:DUF4345 family protein n=1 Tax=Oceanicoccus sp. KOV_DT_Chl TaxID=1904639 RepID=UPI000C7C6EAE|nr:DUF4345 family protein [Oceanicoccus sp. KOV_DT_Chl]